MITRRSLMQFAIAAPLVGAPAVEGFEEISVSVGSGPDKLLDESALLLEGLLNRPLVGWQGMGALLASNLLIHDQYTVVQGLPERPRNERTLLTAAAFRFSRYLLHGDVREPDLSNGVAGKGGFGRDLGAPFDPAFPNHDATILDRVEFAVADYVTDGVWRKQADDTWVLDSTSGQLDPLPMFRKLRVRFNWEEQKKAMEDLSCHGLDAEAEICDMIAMQAAFEVHMEIRNSVRVGRPPVKLYAIRIPPILSMLVLSPEFSSDRRWRMQYSKQYET